MISTACSPTENFFFFPRTTVLNSCVNTFQWLSYLTSSVSTHTLICGTERPREKEKYRVVPELGKIPGFPSYTWAALPPGFRAKCIHSRSRTIYRHRWAKWPHRAKCLRAVCKQNDTLTWRLSVSKPHNYSCVFHMISNLSWSHLSTDHHLFSFLRGTSLSMSEHDRLIAVLWTAVSKQVWHFGVYVYLLSDVRKMRRLIAPSGLLDIRFKLRF